MFMCSFSPLEHIPAIFLKVKLVLIVFLLSLEYSHSLPLSKCLNLIIKHLMHFDEALYELVGLSQSFHLKSHRNQLSLSRSRMIASPEIHCNKSESRGLSEKREKCQRNSKKGESGRRNFNGEIETA